MNEFIVRTTNIEELSKHATITYKAKILDFVIAETALSKEEISKLHGVYSVKLNDVFGTLCG